MTWIQKKLNLDSREQAVAIGEALMHRGRIYHVLHNEPFADSKTLYYRFSKQSEDDDEDRNGIGSKVCRSLIPNRARTLAAHRSM